MTRIPLEFFLSQSCPYWASAAAAARILLITVKIFLSQYSGKWQPTPVFLPGKSHGQKSLLGYSPWGRKESDRTERLHFHSFSWRWIAVLPVCCYNLWYRGFPCGLTSLMDLRAVVDFFQCVHLLLLMLGWNGNLYARLEARSMKHLFS